MLEGKFEKLEFPRNVELTSLENRNEQEQNKNVEKRNQEKWRIKEKNDEKEEEMNEGTTKNDLSCNDKKMILGLITLKHNLGLFILSFETINPDLHYVPEKSILIECGYLD